MKNRLDFLLNKREAIREIAFRHKALSISVFGSVARGEDSENSDYDFLVTFEEGSSLLDVAGLKHDLEDYLRAHVDMISMGGLKTRDTSIRQKAIEL